MNLNDIYGFFDFELVYDLMVEKATDGDIFVEVGSFLGKSTVYLASLIKKSGKNIKVYAVDTWVGDKHEAQIVMDIINDRGGDIYNEFMHNIKECKVDDVILPLRMTSAEASKTFSDKSIAFVFIDACHDYESVSDDTNKWINKVKDNGYIGGHDGQYLEVSKAIDDNIGLSKINKIKSSRTNGEYSWIHQVVLNAISDAEIKKLQPTIITAVAVDRSDVAIIAPLPDSIKNCSVKEANPNNDKVMIMIPRYNNWLSWGTACSIFGRPSKNKSLDIIPISSKGSLLAYIFNVMWCNVLKFHKLHNLKYVGMIHSDVEASQGWIDTLIEEMNATGADLVSAVCPIKSQHGLTSTAVYRSGESACRRLTLHEIHRLPETFNEKDINNILGHDGTLLINTGCWLMNVKSDFADKIRFHIDDRIIKDIHGDPVAAVMPEDWNMSVELNKLGAKIFATRKVGITHHGEAAFENSKWGEWETDKEYYGMLENIKLNDSK